MEKNKDILKDNLKDIPELNTWTLNKKLIKETSIHSAIVFDELKHRSKYSMEKYKVFGCFWFNFSQEDMQEKTGLSAHEQRNAIKKLIEKKVISVKKMGLPAKNYFSINYFEIIKNNF
jgi:transcription initiation factor IIE alpha subunit